jgi:hypothetical protein
MKTTKQHNWSITGRICMRCGCLQDDTTEAREPCEPEDLSAWCAPGQSVTEMLRLAAEKDS